MQTLAKPLPRAPRGLGPRGRKAWKRLWEDFEFLDQRRVDQVIEFCRCLDRIEAYEETLLADGLIIEGRWGPKEHPAAIAQRAQIAQLIKLAAALELPDDDSNPWDGLSASSRARKAALARWGR